MNFIWRPSIRVFSSTATVCECLLLSMSVCENPLTNIFWMDRNLTIARFHPNDTYILMVWSRKEACRVISLHPTSNYIKKKDTNECKCCIFSKHFWISSQVIILWIPISFSNVWLISFLWISMIRHSPAKQIPSYTRQRKEI